MLHKNWVVLTPVLLIFSLGLGEAQKTTPFPDVPANHWAYSAVMDLHKSGLYIRSPKEYDNSTAEACWETIVKAMERGNEKVLRELMSEEVWKEYTSGKSVRKDRLAYFRRRAKFYHEMQGDDPMIWNPAEETAETSSRTFFLSLSVLMTRLQADGPGGTTFFFKKGTSGWKLINIVTI